MKRMIVLMSGIMMTGLSMAQTDVPVSFEVSYETKYQRTAEDKQPREDLMVLQIGEGASLFFSQWERRNQEVMDSLKEVFDNPFDMMAERKRLVHSVGQPYKIYKNLPDDGKLTGCEKMTSEMYYTEDMPAIDWQMEDGDTVIANYQCQKATGEFRGRKWTAWFTVEIPVSDGPWKLCGLPGLILGAEESDNIFSFRCVGIKKTENVQFSFNTKKWEKSSLEKLQELTELSINDVAAYIKNTLGLDTDEVKDQNGNPIPKNQKTVVFIEKIGKKK